MKHGDNAETLSQDDLRAMFKNEDKAVKWVESIVWRKTGIVCGKCGSTEKIKPRANKRERRYWCGACRSTFTVKTNTPMADANIGVRQWIEAAYLLMTARFGISSYQLSKQLGITQKSVWYLLQRIRLACGANLEMKFRKLTGTVEIDETFLGPVVGRMNDVDKAKWEAKWGKNQRGTKGKNMVIGLRERETGYRIYLAFKPNQIPRKPTVEKIIAKYVEPGATIYTDEASYYTDLCNLGYKAEAVKHSTGKEKDAEGKDRETPCEWVKGLAWTNGIESDWAVMKRAWKGTYVHWSTKHCQLYANEFSFRLDKGNVKRDTIDRLESLFSAMVGKTITYKELIKRDTEENTTGAVRRDPAFNRDLRKAREEQQRDWWEDDCIPY